MCMCSFGVAPSVLNIVQTEMTGNMPGANMMDNIPFMNVPPFGMCTTPSNPAVAAATAAALGVPTPMPCTPVLVAPWIPGPVKSLLMNFPMINQISTLMCAYGGVIMPVVPAQFNTLIQS